MAHLTKAILSCGEHHSPDGILRVTPERIRHWANTFNAMQQASLQIPVGVNHSDKLEENVPLYVTHTAADAEHAVGKLVNFEPKEDHAVITLDIGPNSLSGVDPSRAEKMFGKAQDNVVEVSPVIFGEWTDGAGTKWNDCITHVDLVLHPVDHKQGEFKPVTDKGMIACSLRMFDPGKPKLNVYRLRLDVESALDLSRKAHEATAASRHRAALVHSENAVEHGMKGHLTTAYAHHLKALARHAQRVEQAGDNANWNEYNGNLAALHAHSAAANAYRPYVTPKDMLQHFERSRSEDRRKYVGESHQEHSLSLKAKRVTSLGKSSDEEHYKSAKKAAHGMSKYAHEASESAGGKGTYHHEALEHSSKRDHKSASESHRKAAQYHKAEYAKLRDHSREKDPEYKDHKRLMEMAYHQLARDSHYHAVKLHQAAHNAINTSSERRMGLTRLAKSDPQEEAQKASEEAHALSKKLSKKKGKGLVAHVPYNYGAQTQYLHHEAMAEQHRNLAKHHFKIMTDQESRGGTDTSVDHNNAWHLHEIAAEKHKKAMEHLSKKHKLGLKTRLALSSKESAQQASGVAHRHSQGALHRSHRLDAPNEHTDRIEEHSDTALMHSEEGNHDLAAHHHHEAAQAHSELAEWHDSAQDGGAHDPDHFHTAGLHRIAGMAHHRAAMLHTKVDETSRPTANLAAQGEQYSLKTNRIKNYLKVS